MNSKFSDLPRGTETILVVEDEDVIRKLTVRILESLGYKTVEATSGQHALAVCDEQEKPVDLVLTDMVMPKLNGAGMVDELSKRWDTMRVIYVSGYTDEQTRVQGLNQPGVTSIFLQKPFTRDTLASKVREILDRV